jgi:hypothetical protein
MKNRTKHYLLVLVLFLISFLGYSQQKLEVPITNRNWQRFFENENLILSSKVVDCNDPAGGPSSTYVLIALENKSESEVVLKWHFDIYNSSGCITCVDVDAEYNFNHTMMPGQSIIPDCSTKKFLLDDGKTLFLGRYLCQTGRSQNSDIVKIELSNFNTYISE